MTDELSPPRGSTPELEYALRDIHEIKKAVATLSNSMTAVGLDLRQFSSTTQVIVQRLDDRDMALQGILGDYKEKFKESSLWLNDLEKRMREAEKSSMRVSFVERVMWSVISAIGALILLYLTKQG